VLVRHGPPRQAVWPVRYATMFHMTNDSGKFHTSAELQGAGAYRVAANRWKKGQEEWLPLLVGRSIHQFDHRYASVVENTENLHNPFGSEQTTLVQHLDPGFVPPPRFWVSRADVEMPETLEWAIAFRDIARPTDARTAIMTAVPLAGFGNTLPILLPILPRGPETASVAERKRLQLRRRRAVRFYAAWAPILLANFNSFAFDFIARQKIQSAHLNFYLIEQLPVVPKAIALRRFGGERADRLIRQYVLKLTYTAHDMAAFARDLGYAGPPFRWDEEERLRLRARLDTLFFLLYGLDREAAEHVLGTFPIVEREEVAKYGRFRSRDLILGYMAAVAAGDITSEIAA
jgi:hypothetical protein